MIQRKLITSIQQLNNSQQQQQQEEQEQEQHTDTAILPFFKNMLKTKISTDK